MISQFKELLNHQFEATFCMLNACIDNCPDESWNEPVVNLKFCQAAFHVLFFVDYYLCDTPEELYEQSFHKENADFFGDYEEMQDRPQTMLYEKAKVSEYLQFVRNKAAEIFERETEDEMTTATKFPRRTFTRGEQHVYNLRHLHHHVAQLSLRLRIDHQIDIPWVGVGWKELS